MTQIGVYLNWNRPDLRDCFRGICEYIRQHRPNWHTVTDAPLQPGDSVAGLAGVIMYSPHCETEWLAEKGIPAVNLATQRHDPHCPQVGLDNIAIGRMAAQHLAQRGFKRFAYFTPGSHRSAQLRREGFVMGIESLGFDRSSLVVDVEGFELQFGSPCGDLLAAALAEDASPIGCLGYDDSAAESAMSHAMQVGLDVPKRVGILGVNNNDFLCDTRFPSLTSIDPDNAMRGFVAGELLAAMIAGESPDTPPLIKPLGVVVRNSTGFATTDDELLDQAIAYIHTNARQAICVDDVVVHVGTNRTTLGRKFRERLGTSPHQRILEARIEVVKDLLSRTNLDTQGIADASNFDNRVHLSKLFKKMTGHTMMQFRKQSRIKTL